jgi:hypothetical protein
MDCPSVPVKPQGLDLEKDYMNVTRSRARTVGDCPDFAVPGESRRAGIPFAEAGSPNRDCPLLRDGFETASYKSFRDSDLDDELTALAPMPQRRMNPKAVSRATRGSLDHEGH